MSLAAAGWLTTLPGYQPQTLDVFASRAWLASSNVGQVALVDGSTADVAARLEVAPWGHDLSVVQLGEDALVVDRTAGTLRHVAAATLTASPVVRPFGAGARDIALVVGSRSSPTSDPTSPSGVFVVDRQRGLATQLDRKTLAAQGDPVTLAATLGQASLMVDAAGVLWAADEATGDVVRVSGGVRGPSHPVARPGRLQLLQVDGHPTVIDVGARHAHLLDPKSGAVMRTTDLDLRPGDTVTFGGSPDEDVVFAGVSNRRIVLIARGGGSQRVVQLPADSGSLGDAVVVGGRAFLPDPSQGKVYVVDLTTADLVASVSVPDGAAPRLDLVGRGDKVFYSVPTSSRAGVITLAGEVSSAVKYEADPRAHLTRPTPDPAPSPSPKPAPTSTSTPRSAATPAGRRGEGLVVRASDQRLVVGQDVTLSMEAGGLPVSADVDWSFGDAATTTGNPVHHAFTAPGTYVVTARGPQGQASTTVSVAARPTAPQVGAARPPPPPPPFSPTVALSVAVRACRVVEFTPTMRGGDRSTPLTITFGDGTSAVTTSGVVTAHTYGSSRAYDASVHVTGDPAVTAVAAPPVDLTPAPLTVALASDDAVGTVITGAPVSFTATVTGGSSCGHTVTVAFNIGPEATATSGVPFSHSFGDGPWTATATVTDGDGVNASSETLRGYAVAPLRGGIDVNGVSIEAVVPHGTASGRATAHMSSPLATFSVHAISPSTTISSMVSYSMTYSCVDILYDPQGHPHDGPDTTETDEGSTDAASGAVPRQDYDISDPGLESKTCHFKDGTVTAVVTSSRGKLQQTVTLTMRLDA